MIIRLILTITMLSWLSSANCQNTSTFFKFGVLYNQFEELNSLLDQSEVPNINDVGIIIGLNRMHSFSKSPVSFTYGFSLIECRSAYQSDDHTRYQEFQFSAGFNYTVLNNKIRKFLFGGQIGLAGNMLSIYQNNNSSVLVLSQPFMNQLHLTRKSLLLDFNGQLLRTYSDNFCSSLKIGTFINFTNQNYQLMRSKDVFLNDSPKNTLFVPYISWEFTWPFDF